MKRIMFYMAALICLTSVFTSCSKDEESLVTPSGEKLVTPTVRAALDEPNGQSPLTGILQAYPCQSESSTFFGNYVNGKLLPVCATYHIVDGHVSGTNSPLSLPAGYYNVGPDDVDCYQTGALVDVFVRKWGDGIKWVSCYDGGPHEANSLKLDCSKLKAVFGWCPRWNLETAIEMVVEWSKCWKIGSDIRSCMDSQIKKFLERS